MSFSSQIKSEMEKQIPSARHCQLAELAALYKFFNKEEAEKHDVIVFSSENELAVRKCFTLLKKTFNMYKEISWNEEVYTKKGSFYRLCVDDPALVDSIRDSLTSSTVTLKACCRRAFIRGAYLAVGSISDPEKSYHLEFVCQNEEEAQLLIDMLATFDVEAKLVTRKKYFVVYVKDGAGIVDILNVMGAHLALMDFENTRILKEVRNSVNRKINCEMANIGKTISAAQKQIEDIYTLMDSEEYKRLPASVQEIAELRIKYPEATLKELGELADPPIGKSGVNHRLRKLSELAEAIKEENYD